jgi:exo-1,4-beta-D-glucosaminidase
VPHSRVLVVAVLLVACGGRSDPPPTAPGDPADAAPAPVRVAIDVPPIWKLQSSAKVDAADEAVAAAGFATAGWHDAAVPGTVAGALIADGTYPDPTVGMALRDLPGGRDYDVGEEGYRSPMARDNPHRVPWWYRTTVEVPAATIAGRRVWLHLDGLNYRGSVWLNGRRIADDDAIVGAYRSFTLDVTEVVTAGANTLAVKVVPSSELGDLGINWVDWAPFPPDKNLGLWRPVRMDTTGPVALATPRVVTDLPLPALDRAALTAVVDAHNATDTAQTVRVEARIEVAESTGGDPLPSPAPVIAISDTVELAPGERRTLRFEPAHFPALNVSAPRLWWPFELGAQNLYRLTVRAVVVAPGADDASDEVSARFGIREIDSDLAVGGHRLFRVNGRKLLVRGAGYAPDLFLRADRQRVADQMAYVRDMRLNTVRVEGTLGDDELYDLADELGILIMAGWCCCDHWEHDDDWDDEDRAVARASMDSQARLLVRHPSTMMWLNGSDNIRRPATEQAYVDVLRDLDWSVPIIAAAMRGTSEVTGPTGMKMNGPYGWVPPSYWSLDDERGGAFGFATEVSMGAAIPTAGSLRRFLPSGSEWPVDDVWRFHAGGSSTTQDLGPYLAAIDARYGAATGLDDLAWKSQLAAYEGVRAMFEAYGASKYQATGVIQWMLNDPWPGLIWHLYDAYLVPGGGYFGAKKALEPLHVQYGYADRGVRVVSSTIEAATALTVRAELLDLAGTVRWTDDATVDVAADAVVRALTVPADAGGLGTAYFLRLRLLRGSQLVSDNLYWLSKLADELDWDRASWFATPQSAYADLSALSRLPAAQVAVTAEQRADGDERIATVTLRHRGGPVGFFLRAELVSGDREVAPVRWSDNHVTLFPGDSVTLEARYRGAAASVRVAGSNVAAVTAALRP